MSTPQKTSFVPLSATTSASRDRKDFKVTVVKEAANHRPFQSPGSRPGAAGGSACEPKVTLQREGDNVTGIQIQCSCGQVIELACVYPAA